MVCVYLINDQLIRGVLFGYNFLQIYVTIDKVFLFVFVEK